VERWNTDDADTLGNADLRGFFKKIIEIKYKNENITDKKSS
jgi:hypothetical protein